MAQERRTRHHDRSSLGRRTIDKEDRGERIFARLGAISQEDAERYLVDGGRPDRVGARAAHAYPPLFSDCAKRFLRESKHNRAP
jgi:hypothetical protein